MFGMFNYFTPAQMVILDDPDVTVEKVLLDPSLSSCIRNSNPKLIEYVKQNEVMTELFDWVLTDQYTDRENYKTVRRQAFLLLATASNNFQKQFIHHPVFIDRLNEFLENDDSDDSGICGSAIKILEQVIRSSSGQILKDLPPLRKFLISHASMSATRELFSILTNDFPADCIDTNFFIELVSQPLDYNIITVFRNIMKQVGSDSTYADLLCCKQFVSILFDQISKKDTSTLLSCVGFELLGAIFDYHSMPDLLIDLAGTYDISSRQIDQSTPIAVRVLHIIDSQIIAYAFEHPGNTFLAEAICSNISRLTGDQLKLVIDENDLLNKLITLNTKVGGPYTMLAEYIDRSQNVESEEWRQFVNSVLRPRIADSRKKDFGGQCPHDDYETETDSEFCYCDNSDSEEEEEDEEVEEDEGPVKYNYSYNYFNGDSSSEEESEEVIYPSSDEEAEEDIDNDEDVVREQGGVFVFEKGGFGEEEFYDNEPIHSINLDVSSDEEPNNEEEENKVNLDYDEEEDEETQGVALDDEYEDEEEEEIIQDEEKKTSDEEEAGDD